MALILLGSARGQNVTTGQVPRYANGKGMYSATITGDYTVSTVNGFLYCINGGSSNRNVDLPAYTTIEGCVFVIYNNGATNNLVVRNSTGVTTIATLTPGQGGFFCYPKSSSGTCGYTPFSGIGTTGAGTAEATGNVAYESGNTAVHKTTLSLTNVAFTATDPGSAAYAFGTKIYTFPQGAILVLGATINCTATAGTGGITDTFNPNIGLGSTVGTGTDITTTEIDTLTKTAAGAATAGVATIKMQSAAAVITVRDGTTTAKEVWFNFLIADADSTASDTVAVTGTVTLTWINLGDY